MPAETRAEWVIVTTVDQFHDEYICRALEAGCHVITEKRDAQPEDRLLRAADQRAGAWSILTGIGANRSIEWGREVSIEELVPGMELPDYPIDARE